MISGYPRPSPILLIGNVLKQYTPQKVWVKLDPVRELYQMGIGAHPDQSKSRFACNGLVLITWTHSPKSGKTASILRI